MSIPKNQHTIPKCYLRQFVDPKIPSNFGPCVWIFKRESKRGKRKNVRSVLTETDVYTFHGDYSIEKSLAQLENEYAVIFEKKIKHKLPLNPYEHAIFCAFVAAMLQRTLKREAYERQKGVCPFCKKERREKIKWILAEMEADHIKPWHEGGKTTAQNCQMLCKQDNRTKSGK